MFYFIFILFGFICVGGEVTWSTTNTQPNTQATAELAISFTQGYETSSLSVIMLGELTGLAHDVSSEEITLINNSTFHISKFYFDGLAPDTHFLVGKGDKIAEEKGVFLPYQQGPLPAFDGEDVEITLDGNIGEIDWLAVWCKAFKQNLGYIYLSKKKSSFPPQTFGLKYIVTSGPVVLVDSKTLFVPNFHYSGSYKNVHFWVGNGSEPDSQGLPIADEHGSTNNLHPYHGQNIYLHLPDKLSTDNIEYFGVWSIDENLNLGHVILKGIEGVPRVTRGDSRAETLMSSSYYSIMRLPKCCPLYSILTKVGCQERPSLEFKPHFNIYEHNETHFNNISLKLDSIQIEPYIFALECPSYKYPLDDKLEEFALLQNGSLLVKGSAVSGVLGQNSFCLDNVEDEEKMMILVCGPEQKIQKGMFIAFITLTIISLFCLAGTFIFYCFWRKIEDIHRGCFTAYVLFMSITFLTLTIVQVAHVEGSGCEFLGFVFQYAMTASFTMMAILCFDILILIHKFQSNMRKGGRVGWYFGVAIAFPTIFLIISLARNQTPDVPNSFFKPQYEKNICYFDEERQRTIYFYIPIGFSIIISIVFLIIAKMKIVNLNKNQVNNYYWLSKGQLYKFMWNKYSIVLLVALGWTVESVLHQKFFDANILRAIELIEAFQGIIIMWLFVLTKETRTEIIKSIKFKKKTKVTEPLNNNFEDDLQM